MKSRNLTFKALIVLTLVLCSCKPEKEEINTQTDSSDPELQAIQQTINGLYDNIRVENGTIPDYDRLLSYFAPNAHLGSVKDGAASLQPATTYFEGWKNAMMEIKPDLLKEWEIDGKSQYFGHVAYHTSHYGVYFNSTEEIAEQGIINYQLMKLEDGWKVISMVWHAEKPDNIIPADYFTQ